ncbi:hypothetical protein RJT34_03901 [Clitoria ternatea]|uniref:Uncharacterized protein n=1 Tax=Clitoria ternatea TaxID=43366 RepID=A0AAN9KN29_CLITE
MRIPTLGAALPNSTRHHHSACLPQPSPVLRSSTPALCSSSPARTSSSPAPSSSFPARLHPLRCGLTYSSENSSEHILIGCPGHLTRTLS